MPAVEEEGRDHEVTPEGTPNAPQGAPADADDDRPSRSGDAAADGMRALGQAMRDAANRETEEIAQFEDAVAQRAVVVLYVYCGSTERKYERAVEECSEFEADVLGQYDVTAAMQDTINLRMDGCDLSKDIRKEYKLSKNRFPQLMIYDFEGKKLASFSSNVSPEVLVEYLTAAKEHVEQLAAKLDR